MKEKIQNSKFIVRNWNSGMTYVELIVVLAIFAIMATVVLFKYSDFGRQISLQNLSQDIALNVVQAQKFALSGKQPAIPTAGSNIVPYITGGWKPAYGVYFNIANPFQFIPFIDADNSKDYTSSFTCTPNGDTEECMDIVNIGQGNKILDLRTGPGAGTPVNSLSITFTRPDSSAYIIDDVNGPGNPQAQAIITISSQDGSFPKHIIVSAAGSVDVN